MSSPHFNKLNPAEHERLSLLLEECSEVIQVVGKILRHGYESKHPNGGPLNRELLEKELGHVMYALELMLEEGDIIQKYIDNNKIDKEETVFQYLHHNKVEVERES